MLDVLANGASKLAMMKTSSEMDIEVPASNDTPPR
jgi:hypothetical protein